MSDFRWASPEYFQWLWVVPIIVLASVYVAGWQVKKLSKHFNNRLLNFLTASVSATKRRFKLAFEVLAVLFMVLALARPQSGQSQKEVTSQGIELMFLFDVSNSMLAEDSKPSRLELAKREMNRFINMNHGNRLGLVAFAGSAILLSPLTTDEAAIRMYIESLSPDSVSEQGTDMGEALNQARKAFKEGGAVRDENNVVTRAVILVSDGEDHSGKASLAAKKLKKEGITLFTLAVGTQQGGTIPIRGQAGEVRGYRKDEKGEVVYTKVHGKTLRQLANLGEGSFYHLTFGSSVIEHLRKDIKTLEQHEFESAEMVDYEEQYQRFLFFGLIFLLASLLLGERKTPDQVWKGRFER